MISYELSDRGIENTKSVLSLRKYKIFLGADRLKRRRRVKTRAFVKTERMFMPVISIPIEDAMSADIHSIMIFKNVAEEEMREHASSKIMDFWAFNFAFIFYRKLLI